MRLFYHEIHQNLDKLVFGNIAVLFLFSTQNKIHNLVKLFSISIVVKLVSLFCSGFSVLLFL